MAKRPESRWKIVHVMLVIAGIALILGWLLTPGAQSAVIASAIIGLGLLLFWVVVFLRSIELFLGVACPACGKRELARKAVASFGERYFFCPHCGVRCRRSLFGLLGPFLWNDASGPEYDYYYEKKSIEDPWDAPPGLEDEDETVTSKTHANLVRNKRLRSPENPNGPGLE